MNQRNVGSHRIGGVWARYIPGYPKYRVDTTGRIWSTVRRKRADGPRLIAPSLHRSTGYLRVWLQVNGQEVERKVHVLVLLAWRGPRPPGHQARHLDGDKTNNRVSNLRWGTASENALDRERHKRSRDEQRHLGLREPQAAR